MREESIDQKQSLWLESKSKSSWSPSHACTLFSPSLGWHSESTSFHTIAASIFGPIDYSLSLKAFLFRDNPNSSLRKGEICNLNKLCRIYFGIISCLEKGNELKHWNATIDYCKPESHISSSSYGWKRTFMATVVKKTGSFKILMMPKSSHNTKFYLCMAHSCLPTHIFNRQEL